MSFMRKICGVPDSPTHCDYYTLSSKNHVTKTECLISDLPAQPVEGSPKRTVRFVVVSDTHELHHSLSFPASIPHGDVFLHCGDVLLSDRLTASVISKKRVKHFFHWVNQLPHAVKIVMAGNHDKEFHKSGAEALKKWASPAIYAENEIVEVPLRGLMLDKPNPPQNEAVTLRVLASPWSYGTSPNQAFQEQESLDTFLRLSSEMADRKEQDAASRVLNVIMTHQGVGVEELRTALQTAKPALHFCGHNHAYHGHRRISGVSSFNAAMIAGRFPNETLMNVTVVDCEVL